MVATAIALRGRSLGMLSPMRSLLLLGLAVIGACGNDRALLELTGSFPDADRVEVLILEARVRVTEQRVVRDDLAENVEIVPYLAQRDAVVIELAGESTDGFRFELSQDGGAYVPLVRVKRGAEVLAMSIYDPNSMFETSDGALDGIEPVSDVTIFELPLQQVQEVEQDIPLLLKGQWMAVSCEGEVKGFAWRLDDARQVRVVTPSLEISNPLDSPDFDCDRYYAGEADCDDLFDQLHADIPEECNGRDDDCNPGTTMSIVRSQPTDVCTCLPALDYCVCNDEGPKQCPIVHVCVVPDGNGGSACTTKIDISGLVGCSLGCTAKLERSPRSWEVRLNGKRPGEKVVTSGKLELEVSGTSEPDVLDPVLISVGRDVHAIGIQMDSDSECGAPAECRP